MSTEPMKPGVTPEQRDDLMAIVNATREQHDTASTPLPHPESGARVLIHPSVRHRLTDDALAELVQDWTIGAQLVDPPAVVDVLADLPIALVPTDHDECRACGTTLCGCLDTCPDLERDVCSHFGRLYCSGCAPHHCADCRIDVERWG